MTPSQLQALEDVERHGDPWHRVYGRSRHGGWSGVMYVIHHKNRWVRYVALRWELTEAGKRALKEARNK